MPRKGPAPRRELMPDPIYRSVVVTQVVNKVLQRGKRSTAERIVYGALEIVADKAATEDPVSVLKRAVENVKPQLEVRSRRVGGATYQVPVEVKPRRANTLAIRWLVGYSRQRREKTMAERLANEILDASNGIGVRTSTRWPSPTRPSPTTAGRGHPQLQHGEPYGIPSLDRVRASGARSWHVTARHETPLSEPRARDA